MSNSDLCTPFEYANKTEICYVRSWIYLVLQLGLGRYNRAIDPIIKIAANECMVEAAPEVIQKTKSPGFAVAVDGS